MPSAVLLSVIIHAAFFLLAGLLVVFTITKKEEDRFVHPKAVERPKMKLRKPKMQVKKSSSPKSTTRIVTKVNRPSMPDIQLPEMSGMGDGLAGGLGDGFDMMPDLDDISIFGGEQTIGNDFVGTFYDFLKDRNGRWIQLSDTLPEFLRGFVRSGWKESYFSRYYRSPKKLYATTCMFPCIESIMARVAYNEFEEGHKANDYYWAIHYKGQLVHKRGIKFRFWGMGSSFLIVRVDGRTVLDAPRSLTGSSKLDLTWNTKSADSHKYWIGTGLMTVGDWITLEPGVPLKMEYLFADWGGGEFSATLLVEVEGMEYPRNRQNGPILPIFKTAELSHDQLDHIMELLVYDSACLTNGPVFCDYDPSPPVGGQTLAKVDSAPAAEPETPAIPEDAVRTWTLDDGQRMDASLQAAIMGNVVLENARGKQQKIPISKLSEEDRRFVELSTPPKLDINFSKTLSQRTVPPIHVSKSGWVQPKLFDYTFGVTLKQTSTGDYNHPLHVEYFAIGKQINGSHTYILLDRGEGTFTPTRENNKSYSLFGDPVLLFDYVLFTVHMGQKPVSYLVTVTDERGKIIQYATPNKWIFEHLENLKKMPVGRFMDKTCTRVHPERPDIGTRRNVNPW